MKKLFLGIILLSSLNAGNLTLLNKMNSRILATLFFTKNVYACLASIYIGSLPSRPSLLKKSVAKILLFILFNKVKFPAFKLDNKIALKNNFFIYLSQDYGDFK